MSDVLSHERVVSELNSALIGVSGAIEVLLRHDQSFRAEVEPG